MKAAVSVLLCGLAVSVHAQLSPEDALKSFELADPALRVELVAAEPLVASPCALAFEERGRLFVAENRGYPIGPKAGEQPAGGCNLRPEFGEFLHGQLKDGPHVSSGNYEQMAFGDRVAVEK